MRRARFAASWVVIGCSAPAARAPVPPPAAPLDAMPAVTLVAPEIDANVPADAAPRPDAFDACSAPFDPQHPVYCNPPGGGLTASIVEIEATDSGKATLEFDRGTADGVRLGGTGELYDAKGAEVPHGHFEVLGAGEHFSTTIVDISPDWLAASSITARFDP